METRCCVGKGYGGKGREVLEVDGVIGHVSLFLFFGRVNEGFYVLVRVFVVVLRISKVFDEVVNWELDVFSMK